MFAIYKREMRSYFTTPIGYVFLAVFTAVNAVIFAMNTYMADTASISNCFTAMILCLIFSLCRF